MRTMGLSLGLVLLCLLCTGAEDLGAVELDMSKIAGKWYITAMATDSESYLQKKDQLKMAMTSIEVLGDGDLNVSFAIPTPGQCMRLVSIYKPTGVLGQYYSSDRGYKTAQVVDTDGKTYAVVFATRVKDGKTLHALRLYSKTREVSPRMAVLFRKLARQRSFTNDMIVMLPTQDECSLDEV
ncbi:lipocalin-like 1 protein [Strigops habroptila]|uniref:Lipocalin like 1 n=1 Tax=Strigops habroptila TaxID=2489341 RepID=A0A672U9K7_STRHB|nr:lipocalin-like 1 protein [Strigops habroptila]